MHNSNILANPHFQTIVPSFFRYSPRLKYQRKSIDTDDGDFLDLDYYEPNKDSNKLAILIHGLEGSSRDSYITNTIQSLEDISVNSLAMNLRSCSGRTNRLLKTYHSGKTEDLEQVLKSIDTEKYKEIYLIGFSIGGNIVLKYLGERASDFDPRIKQAIVISPPLDLESSAKALAQPNTRLYMKRLLKNLKAKIKTKVKLFPGQISYQDFSSIKNFYDYDGRYTAPLNSFMSAKDYWQKASSVNLLEDIKVETTILSSYDDPFLGPECFPEIQNSFVETQYRDHGGHLGFWDFDWGEFRTKYLYQSLILEKLASK